MRNSAIFYKTNTIINIFSRQQERGLAGREAAAVGGPPHRGRREHRVGPIRRG